MVALRRSSKIFMVMALSWTALVFMITYSKSYAQNHGNHTPKGDLPAALKLLRSGNTGRQLLSRAEKVWSVSGDLRLLEFFELGKVSRTDAVLTRHFNTDTGQEKRERQITISIRQDQTLQDMVLDMAHELTHATAEPAWDPYDPNLTMGKYIFAALEGPGGEVEAVVSECNVALELFDSASRCRRYVPKSSGKRIVDRDEVKKDFYRVGKWKNSVAAQLGAESVLFPSLSSDKPELYSSTGQSPYPVALVQEVKQLNEIACENVKRRIQAKSERSPASTRDSAPDTREILSKRCGVLNQG